jgi:hypothetical protein
MKVVINHFKFLKFQELFCLHGIFWGRGGENLKKTNKVQISIYFEMRIQQEIINS